MYIYIYTYVYISPDDVRDAGGGQAGVLQPCDLKRQWGPKARGSDTDRKTIASTIRGFSRANSLTSTSHVDRDAPLNATPGYIHIYIYIYVHMYLSLYIYIYIHTSAIL